MNAVHVVPSQISGTVRAPASKSETHREFVLSALASGTSVVRHPLLSADTLATLKGLEALGARVCSSCATVAITGGNLHAADCIVDCGNSGTTLRMLVAVAAGLAGTTRFTGDASLMARPMAPLLSALESCGALVAREGNVISVTGPISPRRVDIAGDISSQFVSALLIAGCSVHLTTPLVSAPYAAMTVAALERRGVSLAVSDGTYTIHDHEISPASVSIGGDWSSAAYLLAAGALAGSVAVEGLDPESEQGDREILQILEKMGTDVRMTGGTVSVAARPLRAIDRDLASTPDLFPIVAVLAAYASGTSRLYGVAHLIYKESNRLRRTAGMLEALGVSVVLHPDGCSITGGTVRGERVSAGDDHRLFMAAVVAGLAAAGPTEITDTANADVSYPAFVHDIRGLGGNLR